MLKSTSELAMDGLYLLVAGWVLGLLSPQLIDFLQKPYRREKIRESLFVELDDLSRKLAGNAYLVYEQRGMIDRPFLDWIKPIVGPFKSRHAELSFAECLDKTLVLSDDQLRVLYHSATAPGGFYLLKKFTAPFLDSQIIYLPLFTLEFQRLVLGIQSKLAGINEEIDNARFHHAKTFDSLDPGNHALVEGNMHNSNLNVAQMCREVCDDITELLSRTK